ncbi:hypothetical protein ACJO73_17090 [Citrobacter freundii]|uniref:hypothetical protein n=1 Tax=Citrobacter freundii TaxID=546 RepID=UPI0025A6C94A|nr:hypothetical protein [Citrobacter freundii]
MSLFTHLTGKRFESLIKYFSESKENINIDTSYTYKCSVAFLDRRKIFGPQAPSPVSTVFLTYVLAFSCLLPTQTITYLLELSSPDSALAIYPLFLIIVVLMDLTMRSTKKGNVWPMIVYKYIYIIDIILFLSTIILSIRYEKKYWGSVIINAGFIVWARLLINSNSFFKLHQFYIHRRLSKLIIENTSKSKRKKHK